MEVHAKQARDGKLIGYATEIPKCAERRLGELMEVDRKAGKLSKGARMAGRSAGRPRTHRDNKPTLDARGVDKHLADRTGKAAALPEKQFEAEVDRAVRTAVGRRGRHRHHPRARMPQRVHTMRGSKVGTGTSSGQGSTLSTAAWWHSSHVIAMDRTPRLRMFPNVIGGPAADRGRGCGCLGAIHPGYGAPPAYSKPMSRGSDATAT
jgi:hypothetical protein